MALARIDKPAVVHLQRADAGGSLARRAGDDPGRLGGGRRAPAGPARPRSELDTLERTACPGPGTCAGHFTANTMGLALEFLGLALPGTTMVAADELEPREDTTRHRRARSRQR